MRTTIRSALALLCLTLFLDACTWAAGPRPGLSNPFYAMDTSFRRPELTPEQQLDLVKEIGFAGVAWTEQAPDLVKQTLAELRKRELKMFTIYCAAKVTPEGDLTHSPTLFTLLATLKGEATIIWLHIGGKGPAFEGLTGKEPAVAKLRTLADAAKANGLQVAIYPHLGEWTARFGDATRLAQVVNHPQFGVSFNLCHCLALGDESQIPQLLADAQAKLLTVTLSGADKGVSGGKWKQLIQPLDQGSFDQRVVLRQLVRQGFTGPIGFQGFGIKLPAREILTPTIAAWRKLSAAAVP